MDNHLRIKCLINLKNIIAEQGLTGARREGTFWGGDNALHSERDVCYTGLCICQTQQVVRTVHVTVQTLYTKKRMKEKFLDPPPRHCRDGGKDSILFNALGKLVEGPGLSLPSPPLSEMVYPLNCQS